MLVKKVDKEGRLDNHPTSESFTMLVASGVLVDSFDAYAGEFFPTVPELFLHSWIRRKGLKCLGVVPRNLLE